MRGQRRNSGQARPSVRAGRLFISFVVVGGGIGGLAGLSSCGHSNEAAATPPPASAPAAAGEKLPVATAPAAGPAVAVAGFRHDIQPLLQTYCYGCHAEEDKNGGIAFDQLKTDEQVLNPQLWLKVLRNTRASIMPPPGLPRPSAEEQLKLEQWIKASAFGADPKNPDPGRVTLRRLNRTEYHNTIRDLLGIDFDVNTALPADDVGYGFDNIGDVLSISPIRLEKFIEAAIAVAEQGVPMDTVAIPTQLNPYTEFLSEDGRDANNMSFYQVRKASRTYHAEKAGDYQIYIYNKIDGEMNPDPQQMRIHVYSDDKEIYTQVYKWTDAEYYQADVKVHWEAGDHVLSFVTEPLFDLQPLRTKMEYRLQNVRVDGPLARKDWVHPPNFKRLYTREAPPADPTERRAYAREVLQKFASKAYRRPVSDDVLNRLVTLAENSYSLPGVTFERGISQAIVAVLASPRFLFHLEGTEPVVSGDKYPKIDEFSLASRLSYALWCSIPDEELTRLAAAGELRKNFAAQVKRMLADPRSQAFVENFPAQWLQTRAILDIPINSADIMAAESGEPAAPPSARGRGAAVAAVPPGEARGAAPADLAADGGAGRGAVLAGGRRGGAGRGAGPAGRGAVAGGRGGRGGRGGPVFTGTELTPEVRSAMKQEVEAYFNYVMRDDRSVLEFLQSNYTFVNAALAPVYGIPNITGPEMRQVQLPPNDPRGGVLTMGGVLTVTSNPTRTSPVKRGKWILENILGAPPAPPPPNVPALEDTIVKITDRRPTQREALAIHRESPLCASCHTRMDPLGLAMENFNGFGRFRSMEFQSPIDPAGELATGEKFSSVNELKAALIKNHKLEYYRTLTGKLMTYILGRGIEYYDIATIDAIVERMDKDDGRFSTLLMGVLESAPFQQRRPTPLQTPSAAPARDGSQSASSNTGG